MLLKYTKWLDMFRAGHTYKQYKSGNAINKWDKMNNKNKEKS